MMKSMVPIRVLEMQIFVHSQKRLFNIIKTGLPVHIFRLPGIYGPTRGPLNKIREGDARRIRKVSAL